MKVEFYVLLFAQGPLIVHLMLPWLISSNKGHKRGCWDLNKDYKKNTQWTTSGNQFMWGELWKRCTGNLQEKQDSKSECVIAFFGVAISLSLLLSPFFYYFFFFTNNSTAFL